MRPAGYIIASLFIAVLSAQQAPSPAQTPQTQPQISDDRSEILRAQARGANGGDRARIYMELAFRDVELANKEFDSGTFEQAQKLIQQGVRDAQAAADAAIRSGNRLKNTEMEMHRLARRLNDIEQSLGVDDRPPVKA